MHALVIRRATSADLPAITEIYNDAILHTTATFDTQPKSEADQQAWFDAHDDRHPVLVAVLDDQVVGWASLSAWSDRCAYADTAEISTYVNKAHRGRRIGSQLTAAIDQVARRLGFHTVLARVSQGNEASLRLCAAAGFVPIGIMREVGLKFGRRLDVHLLQKIYG
jgi:phosphinothricin acetyltransferase